MSEKIKTGNEIVDDFFNDITKIEGIDGEIATALNDLHVEGKLTDTNIKNKLRELRDKDDSKNQ